MTHKPAKKVRIISVLLFIALILSLSGCKDKNSILDSVKILNVTTDSNGRGYTVKGEIENQTNQTFPRLVVVYRVFKNTDLPVPTKNEYFIESGNLGSLGPNDTKKFSIEVTEDKVDNITWFLYSGEVYDVRQR